MEVKVGVEVEAAQADAVGSRPFGGQERARAASPRKAGRKAEGRGGRQAGGQEDEAIDTGKRKSLPKETTS